MANYDWLDFKDEPLRSRFPSWARGTGDLRQYLPDSGVPFRSRDRRGTFARPRLFISHKQQDKAIALDVASTARQEGWEYWLDVLDPDLAILTSSTAPSDPAACAMAVASIIEVALINCTHVVAVMTERTLTSRWVPYEYGRVQDDQIAAGEAASYSMVSKSDLPEYHHLGPICMDKPELRRWLQDAHHTWQRPGGVGS